MPALEPPFAKRAEIFGLGLLSVGTSKVFTKIQKNKSLNEEDAEILKNAKDFVEKISNGERFVTQLAKEKFVPDLQELRLLNYLLAKLSVVDVLNDIAQNYGANKYRKIFNDFSELFSALEKKNASYDKEVLVQADTFFLVLSEQILQETQQFYFESEPIRIEVPK